jgi:cobalt-zinc-cadmium efflux system outer membrane protein
MRRLGAALAAAWMLGGCVPKEAGFPDVAKAIEERTGYSIRWSQDSEAGAAIRARVRVLLTGELTGAAAVEIALLNNPALQATYEELMIAQADLVQAGLAQNPKLTGNVGFALPGTTGSLAYGFGLELDFLDLVLIPAKKRVAAAEFEAAKLRVGNEVLALAHGVRVAYYTLQGAQQIAGMRRTVLDAAEASVELARRQHAAGNISELDLANEEGLYEQVRLDVERSEAEALAARERLIRLLGLWGQDTRFATSPTLANVPEGEPPLEHLEGRAIERRLDVAAARQEAQASSYALAMAKNYRFLGGATVGAAMERDPEGRSIAGPTASLELPLFDAKQALVAKLEARLRQAERRLAMRSIEARSEVREAWARVGFAQAVVTRYRTTVIPLRERIVALSQRHYDAMLLGVYQLLLAKQAEVNAYREYIEAVRDYWIARSELEHALGGKLPPSP